ncbi:MAG TPA: GtrA family protein [Rubrobacter sp.]
MAGADARGVYARPLQRCRARSGQPQQLRLNTLWTFRGRAEYDARQIVLFALQVLVNIGISSGLFWALIHPIIVYTEVPAYPAWNAAKIISVTVASTISFLSSATS